MTLQLHEYWRNRFDSPWAEKEGKRSAGWHSFGIWQNMILYQTLL